jgi:hypothetical protein
MAPDKRSAEELHKYRSDRQLMRRNLSEFEISQVDKTHRETYAPLDTFFVESMGAQAGLSRRTVQNKIYNGEADFIRKLDGGRYGSCASSMAAYGQMLQQKDRRRTHWRRLGIGAELRATIPDGGDDGDGGNYFSWVTKP